MAIHARAVASVAVLAAVLASPPEAAAEPRRAAAGPGRAQASQRRTQGPSGAARAGGAVLPAERASTAWDDDAVVRWEDEDGTVHYTRGYEVPRRFRPRVRHVDATVGTVPADRAEAKKEAASVEVPAPVAALPVAPVPPPAAAPPGAPAGPPGTSQGSATESRQPAPGATK